MARRGPRRPEPNAGAFYTPYDFSMIPIPMRTLDNEYRDEPAEPRDSDVVPAPDAPGPVRRIVKRLAGSSRPSAG